MFVKDVVDDGRLVLRVGRKDVRRVEHRRLLLALPLVAGGDHFLGAVEPDAPLRQIGRGQREEPRVLILRRSLRRRRRRRDETRVRRRGRQVPLLRLLLAPHRRGAVARRARRRRAAHRHSGA
jgi:hypothetical protein